MSKWSRRNSTYHSFVVIEKNTSSYRCFSLFNFEDVPGLFIRDDHDLKEIFTRGNFLTHTAIDMFIFNEDPSGNENILQRLDGIVPISGLVVLHMETIANLNLALEWLDVPRKQPKKILFELSILGTLNLAALKGLIH